MKPVDAPIRRSVLITAGSQPKRIASAAAAACDAVVIDLEDGVAPSVKADARRAAADALASVDFGARERAVRVNASGTPARAVDGEASWHRPSDDVTIHQFDDSARRRQ